MLLSTNIEYVELANQIIYISGQIYSILAFLLLVLVVWLAFKLFNMLF